MHLEQRCLLLHSWCGSASLAARHSASATACPGLRLLTACAPSTTTDGVWQAAAATGSRSGGRPALPGSLRHRHRQRQPLPQAGLRAVSAGKQAAARMSFSRCYWYYNAKSVKGNTCMYIWCKIRMGMVAAPQAACWYIRRGMNCRAVSVSGDVKNCQGTAAIAKVWG